MASCIDVNYISEHSEESVYRSGNEGFYFLVHQQIPYGVVLTIVCFYKKNKPKKLKHNRVIISFFLLLPEQVERLILVLCLLLLQLTCLKKRCDQKSGSLSHS